MESAASPSPQILDVCCGGRMWWWDKAHPLAVYMDKRIVGQGATGHWNPAWECRPARWLIFYKPLLAAELEAVA